MGCGSVGGSPIHAVSWVPRGAVRVIVYNAPGFHEVFWIECAIRVWFGDEQNICVCVPDNDIRYMP